MREGRRITLEEVAHHEAAHAVLHFFQQLPVRRITIQPEVGSLGYVEIRRPQWFVTPETPVQEDRQRIYAEREIIALYAGRIAQAKYARKRIHRGYESDEYQIADIASSVISLDDETRYPFLIYCRKLSASLVERYWPYIEAVAQALVERKQLRPAQFRQVIADVPVAVIRAHQARRALAAKQKEGRHHGTGQ